MKKRGLAALGAAVLFLISFAVFAQKVVHPAFVEPSPELSSLGHDFAAYYLGAWEITEGRSPYAGLDLSHGIRHELTDEGRAVLGTSREFIPGYVYPPFLALCLQPVVPLGFRNALPYWLLFTCLLAFACLLLCARLFLSGEDWLLPAGLLTLVVLGSMPTRETILLGQVNFLTLALCLAALIASERKRLYLAGGLLAVAAWIKLTPALLLLYFVYHKRAWPVLTGFVLCALALGVWAVSAIGLSEILRYATQVLPLVGQSQLGVENKSFLALFDRLFRPNPLVTPIVPWPALGVAAKAALVGGLLYFAYRLRRREINAPNRDAKASDRFLYAGMLVLTLLCQPLLEIHHLIFVFPALAFLSGRTAGGLPAGAGLAALLAAVLLNTRGWNAVAALGEHWTSALLVAPQAWGLLLLSALLYGLGSRDRRRQSGSPSRRGPG